MRNRLLPLALLALASVAAGLWLAFRGGGRGPERERAAPAPAGVEEQAPSAALADAPRGPDGARAPEPGAVPVPLPESLESVEAEAKEPGGETVRGTVLDDRGMPLEQFRIQLVRFEPTASGRHGESLGSRWFEDAGGAFALTGLEPGPYALTVGAYGHLGAEDIEVDVPRAAELSPIRLTRAARLSGVVLAPHGEPAPGARVQTTGRAADREKWEWDDITAASEVYRAAAETDAEGRFDANAFGPGAVKVRAARAGFAPSEAVELELVPGGSQEGLTLRLREGVKLTGVVLDAGGKGSPRRAVTIGPRGRTWIPGKLETSVTTDENGAFELAGLEPGTFLVVVPPTEAELAGLGLSSAADGAVKSLSAEAEVDVTADGGHVVVHALGAGRAVRVFGTITASGEPERARLRLASADALTSTESDARGAYELVFPSPGEYALMIALDGGRGASAVQKVTIQGPAEQRLDLDVPVGAVEGRVLGPDGPAAGIAVSLFGDEEGLSTVGLTRTTTDEQGRYAIEKLPAGTWAAQAGGSGGPYLGGPEGRRYTPAGVGGIAVASGQRVQVADLLLGAAGAVIGRVLTDEGEPASDTYVRVRRSGGAEEGGSDRVGEQGGFNLGGLAPGVWTVHALQGLEQAAEAVVTVEAGKETQVDLRLAPATHLRVVVRDAAGAPLKARVTCTRSDGTDFTGWSNRFAPRGRAPEGEYRLGPLAPGTYMLQADLDGATSEPKTVTLKGEPELLVELVL